MNGYGKGECGVGCFQMVSFNHMASIKKDLGSKFLSYKLRHFKNVEAEEWTRDEGMVPCTRPAHPRLEGDGREGGSGKLQDSV